MRNNTADGISEFRHRYKWSLEERIILGILTLGALALLWATFFSSGAIGFSVGYAMLAGAVIVIDVWVGYIGLARKNKSELIAHYDARDTRLGVGGHKLEELNNNILLSKVNRVSIRSHGNPRDGELFTPRDECVLAVDSDSGSKTVRFPLRLFSDAKFAQLVDEALKANSVVPDADTSEAMKFGRLYKG